MNRFGDNPIFNRMNSDNEQKIGDSEANVRFLFALLALLATLQMMAILVVVFDDM